MSKQRTAAKVGAVVGPVWAFVAIAWRFVGDVSRVKSLYDNWGWWASLLTSPLVPAAVTVLSVVVLLIVRKHDADYAPRLAPAVPLPAANEQSKKAVLKLALPTPPATNLTGPTTYQLFLLNDGDKAEGGYWYLVIPKRIRGRVEFLPSLGNEEVLVPADNWHIAGAFDQPLVSCFSDDFFLAKFKAAIPVEPGEMAPCAKISVVWQDEARDQSQRVFLWFTKGPSGRFPERGMKKLRLYSVSDAVFKAQYGGQVLPPDDPDDMA